MAKTIVGLFESTESAQDAVNGLVSAGCAREDISMLAPGQQHLQNQAEEEKQGTKAPEGAATGAGIGVALGGLGGVLAGLGLLAIPGIGPILAAGPIAAGLAGAAGGAVAGGLIGGLVGMGIPEEEAHAYAEGVRRGNTLVTVRAPDDMADNYAAVMNKFSPINITSHAADWREKGWSGRFEESRNVKEDKDSVTIPLASEELAVGKRTVEAGGVRVHTYVTEKPVSEPVTLREEKVKVERIPADRAAEPGEAAFTERAVEMRETAEEPVVAKRTRVREEVKISKENQEHEEDVTSNIREADADIEHIPGQPGSGPEHRPHR